MTPADLTRLRALAEAAQRGPWEVAFAGEHSRVLAQQGDGVWREIDADRGGKSRANAAFIAACSPTTVLALLDEIARLTASAAEALVAPPTDDAPTLCGECGKVHANGPNEWATAILWANLNEPTNDAPPPTWAEMMKMVRAHRDAGACAPTEEAGPAATPTPKEQTP